MSAINIKSLFTTGLLLGLLLCVGLITTVSATDAGAPTEETIALSPTSKTYKLDAGETRQDELSVINAGPTPFRFTVYAKPYSVVDENYEPDFYNEEDNTDVHSWIKPENVSYSVLPSQTIKVKYTIDVPKNAAPGGHYGVIFVETQVSESPTGISVEKKKRLGALVYATVNGTFEVGGKLSSVNTPVLQFKPPLKNDFKIQNTGNTDFPVTAVFGVSDLFGNIKYSATKEYRVLPQTTRKISQQWEQSPPFGLFKVTTSVKFLDQQSSHTSYVLMAPLLYYMIFVVGLLIAVIFFVQKRR